MKLDDLAITLLLLLVMMFMCRVYVPHKPFLEKNSLSISGLDFSSLLLVILMYNSFG